MLVADDELLRPFRLGEGRGKLFGFIPAGTKKPDGFPSGFVNCWNGR